MSPGPVLRPAAVAADPQAAADGRRATTDISRSCAASATRTCAPIRQPEFTQIDCEMSFVEQRRRARSSSNAWAKHLFKHVLGIEHDRAAAPRMPWADAMETLRLGQARPPLRHGSSTEITDAGHRAQVSACSTRCRVHRRHSAAEGCAAYTRKQLDALTEFVKRPQIGAKGLIGITSVATDGRRASRAIDKFGTPRDRRCAAAGRTLRRQRPGDLVAASSPGRASSKTLSAAVRACASKWAQQLGACAIHAEVRPAVGGGFPCSSSGTTRRSATTPCTIPSRPAEARGPRPCLDTAPGQACGPTPTTSYANGVGDRRRFDPYPRLGIAAQDVRTARLHARRIGRRSSFGFLMNAFKYGAPPSRRHSRSASTACVRCSAAPESIRDYIAFPKNNAGPRHDARLPGLHRPVAARRTVSGAAEAGGVKN